jgi:hypothetical protein
MIGCGMPCSPCFADGSIRSSLVMKMPTMLIACAMILPSRSLPISHWDRHWMRSYAQSRGKCALGARDLPLSGYLARCLCARCGSSSRTLDACSLLACGLAPLTATPASFLCYSISSGVFSRSFLTSPQAACRCRIRSPSSSRSSARRIWYVS